MKPKIIYRTRYRDRPQRQQAQVEITGGPVNVGSKVSNIATKAKDFQQILYTLGIIAASCWFLLGPFVDAQADTLFKNKLVELGLDPANIQALNKNLEELQKSSEGRDAAVAKVQDDLGKVLDLLKEQSIRQQLAYPPVMQAAPMPLAPVQ